MICGQERQGSIVIVHLNILLIKVIQVYKKWYEKAKKMMHIIFFKYYFVCKIKENIFLVLRKVNEDNENKRIKLSFFFILIHSLINKPRAELSQT